MQNAALNAHRCRLGIFWNWWILSFWLFDLYINVVQRFWHQERETKKKSPHHTQIFHVQFIPAIKSNLITEQGVKSMFVLVASLKCTNSRRNTFLTHLTIPIEPYLVPYSICTCKNNLLYHLTLSLYAMVQS